MKEANGAAPPLVTLSGHSIIDGLKKLGYRTLGTGAVNWFVPKSKAWLRFRNVNFRLMALLPGDGITARIALKAANAITLKRY